MDELNRLRAEAVKLKRDTLFAVQNVLADFGCDGVMEAIEDELQALRFELYAIPVGMEVELCLS